MTSQQLLQSWIDSTDAKTLGLKSLIGHFDAKDVAVTPTPPAPPPIIVKRTVQDKHIYAHEVKLGDTSAYSFANETISDGGFLHVLGTGEITVNNCQNEKGNQASGGVYFLMLWPSPMHGEAQAAVSKCTVNATGCTLYQSPNEAIIRGKCDDFTMNGGTFVPHLKADGTPVKPVLEIRHGKSWVLNDGEFTQGAYPEIGQQLTKQPDGSSKLETSQQVGTVTFNRYKFSKRLADVKPGVQHVVYNNCIGPDGKVFSKSG